MPGKGSPRPRRVRRSERTEQLLDVALELIADRGYDAVSVQAITRSARITKPTMYRIYPGVHALLLALLVREHRRAEAALAQVIPGDPGDRRPAEVMANSLGRLLRAVMESPLTWRLVLCPDEAVPAPLRAVVGRRREQLVDRARAVVRWGARYLPEEDDLDEDVIARMLVSWGEECARMVLDGDGAAADDLVATATALLDGIEWLQDPT